MTMEYGSMKLASARLVVYVIFPIGLSSLGPLSPEVRGESSNCGGVETMLLHTGAVSDACRLRVDNQKGC